MRARSLGIFGGLLLTGCGLVSDPPPPLPVPLHQNWQLQPGDRLEGNHEVQGSLGDISIAPAAGQVFAPFDGTVRPDPHACLIFESATVPGYLFRLCGLSYPKFGTVRQGDRIGNGRTVHFAALRKRADGTWALVEPSVDILTRMLNP